MSSGLWADLIGGSKGSEKISILKSGLEVEKDTRIKIVGVIIV